MDNVRETSDGHRRLNDATDSATLPRVYRKNDTRDGGKEWGEGFTRVNINVCEQPCKYEKADSARRKYNAIRPRNLHHSAKLFATDFLTPILLSPSSIQVYSPP